MKTFPLFCALSALMSISGSLSADTWCNSAVVSNKIFCEDFDRYCNSPPGDPTMPCSIGDSKDGSGTNRLRNNWPNTSVGTAGGGAVCGSEWSVEEDTRFLTSNPFGGRCVNGGDEGGHLGQQTADLVDGIQATFGSQYTTVIGTDAAPLILRFDMSGGVIGNFSAGYDNGYMELGLDNNPGAPMDYVMVGDAVGPDAEGCFSCYNMCPGPNFGPHVAWPSVCQSYAPRTLTPACPTNLLTDVRSALSVGALALLDNNPCHCENPADQVPNNWHLSYYDGLKWRILDAGLYPPIPGYAVPSIGNKFALGLKNNSITMWVKTNTVEIAMTTRLPDNSGWVTYTASDVPRLYLGPFNKLRSGSNSGNELEPDVANYHKIGNRKCIRMGDSRCDGGGFHDNKSNYLVFDGVLLFGGTANTQDGACCLQNATCQETTQANCTTLNGKFNGIGSFCASVVCCHHPFADGDGDGDVDMNDYAKLQTCYTGGTESQYTGVPSLGPLDPCQCFDRAPHDNNRIDADDFDAFKNCVTGPIDGSGPSAKVPWLQANTPNCVSPWPPP